MNNIVQRNVNLPAARYEPDELRQKLEVYRDQVSAPTWAGTAAFLGMPRELLDAHLDGLVASSDKDALREVLQIHRTCIEAHLESVLTREKGSPAGAQFYLKSRFGWEDRYTIDLNARPTLSIVVDGGSELAKLLSRSDVEDAEVIEDDDSDWLG